MIAEERETDTVGLSDGIAQGCRIVVMVFSSWSWSLTVRLAGSCVSGSARW
jgi:hypothetical protein